MYDKQSNACITKTKENQACIWLPNNAEWNISTGVIQKRDTTTRTYLPTYSTTPSTTTCVFKCKSWYNYITRLCQ
jgi:hypothetical protein